MIKEVLAILIKGKDLSETQSQEVMLEIMEGKATSAQIAAFLTALRMKKESVEEIAGLAHQMMRKVIVSPGMVILWWIPVVVEGTVWELLIYQQLALLLWPARV